MQDPPKAVPHSQTIVLTPRKPGHVQPMPNVPVRPRRSRRPGRAGHRPSAAALRAAAVGSRRLWRRGLAAGLPRCRRARQPRPGAALPDLPGRVSARRPRQRRDSRAQDTGLRARCRRGRIVRLWCRRHRGAPGHARARHTGRVRPAPEMESRAGAGQQPAARGVPASRRARPQRWPRAQGPGVRAQADRRGSRSRWVGLQHKHRRAVGRPALGEGSAIVALQAPSNGNTSRQTSHHSSALPIATFSVTEVHCFGALGVLEVLAV